MSRLVEIICKEEILNEPDYTSSKLIHYSLSHALCYLLRAFLHPSNHTIAKPTETAAILLLNNAETRSVIIECRGLYSVEGACEGPREWVVIDLLCIIEASQGACQGLVCPEGIHK